jgi:hypothetical protein
MHLDRRALGLALGLLWGGGVFVATLWIVIAGMGGEHLALLRRFYLGYSVTVVGALIGLVYGFIDGFIGGWLTAWLYNRFATTRSA